MSTEWASNAKTIHAWRPWISRDNRRKGYRSLCGVSYTYEFGWSLPVTEEGSLDAAKRHSMRPVCETCSERVLNRA